MFSVPGWSVSADALKTEKPAASSDATAVKSRKRKRGNKDKPETENVTPQNFVSLWESVVERRKPSQHTASQGKPGGSVAKRQKSHKGQKSKPNGDSQDTETVTKPEHIKDDQGTTSRKDKKKPSNGNSHGQSQQTDSKKKNPKETSNSKSFLEETGNPANKGPVMPTPAPPPVSKLTPLQASMREKLVSARFRHLNETLYTRPSEEAYSLFQDSPEMFNEYHEGFRRQVQVWPENPVDSFLKDIMTRGKVKPFGKRHPGAPGSSWSSTPLLRTAGTCTIADLGCGDARLAESLQPEKDKLRISMKSYDLQSPSALVTKADIANLPDQDGSVNIAIFCLALMGTNWIDFIEEAYRILHWKGELWVAEIKSRFGPIGKKHAAVTHSVGNRKKIDKKTIARDAAEEQKQGTDLAVEVDGADDRRRETDVSAFVEVLKSRGFVLQGDGREGVDLSNKMFVKMYFTKNAAPTKGKGVESARPIKGKREAVRWPDGKEEEKERSAVDEAAVLKPCVYKLR